MAVRRALLLSTVAFVSALVGGCSYPGMVDPEARNLANQAIHAAFVDDDEAKLIALSSPDMLRVSPPGMIHKMVTVYSRACGKLKEYELDRGLQQSFFSVTLFRTLKQARFVATAQCRQHPVTILVQVGYDRAWKLLGINFNISMM